LRRVSLLRRCLIVRLHCRGWADVAICRQRPADCKAGWTAMIYIGKLRPVGAGNVLILDLRTHGRSMLFMPCRQLRGSGSRLDATLSAVEADTRAAAPVVSANGAVVDIVNHGDVDVIDGAIVVEVSAAPVAALIADAAIAIAVINAAIVADVRSPVATVKAVAVMVVAPVAGGPERALVGSLDPSAGNPVVAGGSIGPVAGGPEVVVAGSRGLVVVGQGRRRLIGVVHGLRAVAGIFGVLVVRTTRITLRSALLSGIHGRRGRV